MKSQKDIFDLFRENEHKLQEKPSNQAWNKLEQRLERQRGRRRILPFNSYLMAASVVGLLVVITMMGGIFNGTNNSLHLTESKGEVRPLEDLVAVQPDREKIDALIAFQRSYQEKVREQPVEEGDGEKKLVVRP